MIGEGEPLRTAEGPSKLDEAKETIQSAADTVKVTTQCFGGVVPMCSASPTTLLPNAGCVMDTRSTCPCRRPIHTERPTYACVPLDIGTKRDCLEISNIEM